jgi:hypothetical protein
MLNSAQSPQQFLGWSNGPPEPPPLTTEDVLRAEADAIHGRDLSDVPKEELYRSLNGLNSAALCLSGGGIRSAAFALGVIQSFAAHPRSGDGSAVETPEASLLRQFHYLSTVSGGGYIGSWLSVWLARTGLTTVWRSLIGRPDGPDAEPAPLAWLRSYSNYLTPELGLLSADTWALVAVYLRNLILNWIVILPALCAAILLAKIAIVLLIGLSNINHATQPRLLVALLGVVFLLVALSFQTSNRPSRRETGNCQAIAADTNADGKFIRGSLVWSILSALTLTQYLGIIDNTPEGALLLPYLESRVVPLATLGGAFAYALAWLTGSCWCRLAGEPRKHELVDFALWTASGLVYGALVGLGFLLYLLVPSGERTPWIAILNSPATYLIVGVPWILMAQWAAEMVFVGLTSYHREFNADQEWLGRAGGWLLVSALGWSLGTFVVFAGFLAEISSTSTAFFIMRYIVVPITAVGGFVVALAGAFSLSRYKLARRGIVNAAIPFVGPLFVGALLFTLSILLDELTLGRHLFAKNAFGAMLEALRRSPPDLSPWIETLEHLFIGFAIAALIAVASSKCININRVSLHALYRNRLIRAFLGASRERMPDPFTGLDPEDDPRMHALWPSPDAKGNWPARDGADWRPFHIVNLTLNIVSSKRLAWQERKAAPFTVSPLHCGTGSRTYSSAKESGNVEDVPVGAFRPSRDYGAPRGMSLGTAMAISGAAANPNMGYHSSPSVTYLMTMFNLRLGWWLGNPGAEGSKTYRHGGPAIAILPLLHETLGLTTDDKPYVHVSDGGHFENLGLYEMVRRRCRFIVVCDAGCDPDFAFVDLGNAVRKISIDLGIPIRFEKLERLKRRSGDGSILSDCDYHAIGEIDYQTADGKLGVENGLILYIKAGYHGTESAGVRSYAMANLDFPHQSTMNQWFTESQFESYRSLGFEIMEGLLCGALHDPAYAAAPSLKHLLAALRAH